MSSCTRGRPSIDYHQEDGDDGDGDGEDGGDGDRGVRGGGDGDYDNNGQSRNNTEEEC